jgi:hypothetical protein
VLRGKSDDRLSKCETRIEKEYPVKAWCYLIEGVDREDDLIAVVVGSRVAGNGPQIGSSGKVAAEPASDQTSQVH